MDLAWFSPLPPEHSDIANFTRRLTPDLQRRFRMQFFSERPDGLVNAETGAPYPTELGGVSPYLLPVLNKRDLPIYNLGNNPVFFSHTRFLSERKPGVVILHDLKMHHFFEGVYRERLGDQTAYLRLMRKYYGQLGQEAGAAYWRQEVSIDFMAQHFPMIEWAVQGALGIVVHTAQTLQAVGAVTGTPAILIPLPYAAKEGETSRKTAPEQFSPTSRARLILFGYLNVNRRIVEFLTALATMPEREHFEVAVVGSMQHQPEVERAIENLGLRGQVNLHGYVAEEVLQAELDRADLAINLRFPSMGEASAAQLRIWDHSLSSLVTFTEGYTSLPTDAVFFVRPEHEAADIQTHLRAFLERPEVFREAGRRGRGHLLANHRPAHYVEQLAEFCGEVDQLRSRHSQLALADRAGAAMAAWAYAYPDAGQPRRCAEQIHKIA